MRSTVFGSNAALPEIIAWTIEYDPRQTHRQLMLFDSFHHQNYIDGESISCGHDFLNVIPAAANDVAMAFPLPSIAISKTKKNCVPTDGCVYAYKTLFHSCKCLVAAAKTWKTHVFKIAEPVLLFCHLFKLLKHDQIGQSRDKTILYVYIKYLIQTEFKSLDDGYIYTSHLQ